MISQPKSVPELLREEIPDVPQVDTPRLESAGILVSASRFAR